MRHGLLFFISRRFGKQTPNIGIHPIWKPDIMTILTRALLSLAAVSFSTNLWAGGGTSITVFWEASATAIPTLGTWSLIAVALLMAIMGVRLLGQQPGYGKALSLFLISGAVVLSVQTARSGVTLDLGIEPSECQAGSTTYRPRSTQGDITLNNGCPNAVTITAYEFPVLNEECASVVEICPVGTFLSANGGSCDLPYLELTDAPGCDD